MVVVYGQVILAVSVGACEGKPYPNSESPPGKSSSPATTLCRIPIGSDGTVGLQSLRYSALVVVMQALSYVYQP